MPLDVKRMTANSSSSSSEVTRRVARTNLTHVIRRVETPDAARVYAVERESFPDPYPMYLLNDLMRSERERFFVAVDSGEIVGYCVGAVAGEEGHILSMAVHPSRRRQGIGADLLSAVVRELTGGGVAGIHLEVRRGNIAAISFYERMGFRVNSQIKGYYADGEDAIVMRRPIAGLRIL